MCKTRVSWNGVGLKITTELKRLIENGVKAGEKMQIELTPQLEMKAFMKMQDLNISQKKLLECIYGLKNKKISYM